MHLANHCQHLQILNLIDHRSDNRYRNLGAVLDIFLRTSLGRMVEE